MREIINIRAREEGIELEEEAVGLLVKYGTEISLRYAIQLMAPAAERAKIQGRNKVTREDVEVARERFASIEESIQHLKEWENKFMK